MRSRPLASRGHSPLRVCIARRPTPQTRPNDIGKLVKHSVDIECLIVQ